MRKSTPTSHLLLLLSVACAPTDESAEPTLDLDAERAGLLEWDRSLAAAASLDTVLATMTPDVRVLAPGAPMVEGYEAVEAMWLELAALPGYSLRFTPVLAEVGRAADLGYTIGTYEMTLPDGGGNLVRERGKYQTTWRRDSDGAWRMAVDMFSANGPPEPVTTSQMER